MYQKVSKNLPKMTKTILLFLLGFTLVYSTLYINLNGLIFSRDDDNKMCVNGVISYSECSQYSGKDIYCLFTDTQSPSVFDFLSSYDAKGQVNCNGNSVEACSNYGKSAYFACGIQDGFTFVYSVIDTSNTAVSILAIIACVAAVIIICCIIGCCCCCCGCCCKRKPQQPNYTINVPLNQNYPEYNVPNYYAQPAPYYPMQS